MKYAVRFAIQTPDIVKSIEALPTEAAIAVGKDVPKIESIKTAEQNDGLIGLLRFEKQEEAESFIAQLKIEHTEGFGYIETHDCHHSSVSENRPCENVVRMWVSEEEKEDSFEIIEQQKAWENVEAVDIDAINAITTPEPEPEPIDEG